MTTTRSTGAWYVSAAANVLQNGGIGAILCLAILCVYLWGRQEVGRGTCSCETISSV